MDKRQQDIQKIISSLPPYLSFDESTYTHMRQKARFIDSEYGEWWTHPRNVLRGRDMKQRSLRTRSIPSRLSTSDVQKRIPAHITLDESTYKNTYTKARFIDSEYGEFWAIPNNILRGRQHRLRGRLSGIAKRSITVDTVKSRLPDHITLDESTYINTKTKARFIDSEYGEFWSQPNNIFNGYGHSNRGYARTSNKLSIDYSTVKARLPSHITLDESTYKNTSIKCRFIDSEYGEWWATPGNVMQGRQHPSKRGSISIPERAVLAFVSTLLDNVNSNNKQVISGYELDIYLPEKKLGIEYHGLYWHSEKQKDQSYHQDKLKACLEKDINLLQIYADEWLFKQDIVKSIIKAKLGLSDFRYYARKLEMKDIDNQTAQEFLKVNHLMGEFRSAKHIGLYAQDTLVSLISYKKYKEGIDISRFCNALNSSVAGGLSKLLKEVERRENPKFIQSWVDLRYGTGDSLKSIGFEHKRTTLGWKWTDGINTFNRLKCRANMDSRRLTEKQHAEELGWYRIYDAGQALYIKE